MRDGKSFQRTVSVLQRQLQAETEKLQRTLTEMGRQTTSGCRKDDLAPSDQMSAANRSMVFRKSDSQLHFPPSQQAQRQMTTSTIASVEDLNDWRRRKIVDLVKLSATIEAKKIRQLEQELEEDLD